MLWVGPGLQWFRVWSPFGMIKTWSMLLVTVLIKLLGFGYLPWLVGGGLVWTAVLRLCHWVSLCPALPLFPAFPLFPAQDLVPRPIQYPIFSLAQP